MKNSKFDIAFIDLEGTDLLSSPVIDYEKFKRAFLICNMVVITNFLIAGVKQPSVPVELEKDADENIIFNLTHYKVVIGYEEVTVSEIKDNAELEKDIGEIISVPSFTGGNLNQVLAVKSISGDIKLTWTELILGTKLYEHAIHLNSSAPYSTLRFYSKNNAPETSWQNIVQSFLYDPSYFNFKVLGAGPNPSLPNIVDMSFDIGNNIITMYYYSNGQIASKTFNVTGITCSDTVTPL